MAGGQVVRRRRVCTVCGTKATTYDITEPLYRRLEDTPADFTMRALVRVRNELDGLIKKRLTPT
jgi:transcriptional regulator NrdR family protein